MLEFTIGLPYTRECALGMNLADLLSSDALRVARSGKWRNLCSAQTAVRKMLDRQSFASGLIIPIHACNRYADGRADSFLVVCTHTTGDKKLMYGRLALVWKHLY